MRYSVMFTILLAALCGCGEDGGEDGTAGTGSAGTGSAGTGAAGTSAPPSGDYARVSQILGGPEQASIGKCAASSCHGGQSAGKADLNFKTATDLLEVLVDVPACENDGMARVKPGSPDESWLWIKLNAEIVDTANGQIVHEGTPSVCTGVSTGFGSRMPQVFGSFPKLSDNDLESVRLWILAGAPGPN